MSDLTRINSDPEYLYPPFRERLDETLAEVAQATGEPWRIVEGYRSDSRQLYLYGQGRPQVKPYGRPGAVVTWVRKSSWHGAGLAADCIPTQRGYQAPRSYWEDLRRIGERHGLSNPAWKRGDLGHLQYGEKDALEVRRLATLWLRRGRPSDPRELLVLPGEIPVYVDGDLVPDADAFLYRDRVHLWIRPVIHSLAHWAITTVRPNGLSGHRALLVRDPREEGATNGREVWVPLRIVRREGAFRGYVAAAELQQLPLQVVWDHQRKTLHLRDLEP